MGSARRAALTALEKCRRADAWSDAVLGSVCDREGLDGRDRGLAAALCYGVLQNRLLLDAAVARHSTLSLGRVEPKVLDILRISAYQLLFLERIPASAAVNEGVALCRALGYSRAAGYVNAVLRALAAAPVLPGAEGETRQRLSLRYSHPLWLVDLLLERLGPQEAEAFLECDNRPVPAALQVNTLRTTAGALLEALAREEIPARAHPVLPDCVLAEDAGRLLQSAPFRDGWFYVQDPAAKFAVLAAQPRPGQRILDVCAAPGGKSFAAAVACSGAAEILACDKYPNKLRRIREGAARLGLSGIRTQAADAAAERPEGDGDFDLVLVDVPCSGLGVIRKKPDIRYKDPSAFAALPGLQGRILENAARSVRPGGTLLYSTCTVRSQENEDVVRAFLLRNPGFSPVDFQSPWGTRSREGMLQLWPQRQDTDGFFIARMRNGS